MFRSISRVAFRTTNSLLGGIGMRLDRVERDFDSRPLDAVTRHRLFAALAAEYERWAVAQQLFDISGPFNTLVEIETFFERWIKTPFRRQSGGSRFNNLLWLFFIAKAYGPEVVIDSGTYEGASAWALREGAPEAKILSFDLDLSQLKQRCDGVIYNEADWTAHVPDWTPSNRVLAYFDDHVDQARRLIEATDRGCTLLIFDDDYPVTSFFQMAPTPEVLPKVEFVLDEAMEDGQVLEWTYRGTTQRWTVDGAYLSQARRRIRSAERLPFTGLTTGVMQTPYRLVVPRQQG
jgi:hypothetical protein